MEKDYDFLEMIEKLKQIHECEVLNADTLAEAFKTCIAFDRVKIAVIFETKKKALEFIKEMMSVAKDAPYMKVSPYNSTYDQISFSYGGAITVMTTKDKARLSTGGYHRALLEKPFYDKVFPPIEPSEELDEYLNTLKISEK